MYNYENGIKNTIEDYTIDDIDIMNYQSYEKVVMQMKK